MRAEGYPYREIAEHCNITIREVSSRLPRMRKRLKRLGLMQEGAEQSYTSIHNNLWILAFELRSPETAANTVKGFQKVINSLSLFPQSHELALVFSSIANIGFTFLESALYFRW